MNIRKHKKYVWTTLGIFLLVTISTIALQSDKISYLLENKEECLKSEETVRYEILNKSVQPGKAKIIIDGNASIESYSFEIDLPRPNHYHPIEIHKCGVYSFYSEHYDYTSRKVLPGYFFSLWKYDYSGDGEEIIRTAELENGALKILFNTDFRVSPDEKYLVLEQGNVFEGDYNIVIKSLSGFKTNSLKDVLRISFKDIVGLSPNIYGSIGFNEWSSDNRYFWGNIFDGADVKAYYRIDIHSGSFDVYEA